MPVLGQRVIAEPAVNENPPSALSFPFALLYETRSSGARRAQEKRRLESIKRRPLNPLLKKKRVERRERFLLLQTAAPHARSRAACKEESRFGEVDAKVHMCRNRKDARENEHHEKPNSSESSANHRKHLADDKRTRHAKGSSMPIKLKPR